MQSARSEGDVQKLIIEVRVNEYAMRDGNPNVPWTPDEIARDAEQIRRAGASILHFHARQPDGSPAHDTQTYARTVRAIRAASDLLVHPTLGQITVADVKKRVEHIRAMAVDPAIRPDFASVDLGSTNIDIFDRKRRWFRTGDRTYINTVDTLQFFVRTFEECHVRTGWVAWTIPFVRTLDAFLEMGIVDEPAYLLFCHTEGGILGGHPATPAGLRAFLDVMPHNRRIEWSVCCKEGNLFPLAMTAIQNGGHVAIGIGDYHYQELGAPTNAVLVTEIVRMAGLLGREVATPHEARHILGIPECRGPVPKPLPLSA